MPRLTIFKKILLITLLFSLLPLLVSSMLLLADLKTINTRLAAEIAETADQQASQSLQMRARQVADSVSDFLHQAENDLHFLSQSDLDSNTLFNFYQSRRGEIWERTGTVPPEVRHQIPLYRSIALIDAKGQEKLVIRDSTLLFPSELRNVADPARTEFRCESYFNRTKALKRGDIYVSHVTGFHLSKQEQLQGAADPESAHGGAGYEGVVRFSAPLFDRSGTFAGIVVLSLDHRHLMEFSQHVDPGSGFATVFPSYKSGNYAFLFDDEGWIITHPKFWDIRGVDRSTGKLVPPYTNASSRAEIESGRIPFNLDHAGFVHPSYPVVADQVRRRQTGSVDITNVGGSKKIMAYAPILYDTGDYRKHGVFGGVTIGFQVNQFHDAARKGSRLINNELGEHQKTSAIMILVTTLFCCLTAWGLSRGISVPLRQLTDGAAKIAAGASHERIPIDSTDEIAELARTFNFMADELQQRKERLLATLDDLRQSRLEILDERNFKTSILESISSAILTFSPEGELTSINQTGRVFLGERMVPGTHFRAVFDGWGDLADQVAVALETRTGFGRRPFVWDRGSGMTHFEIGFFPIVQGTEKGITVTLRNETEKEKLREEMMRLDRLASLGKLSAGIAHEVRNPLTGISLMLDDLHDRTASGSGDQEMIKKALTEIERVERLINALLNYSSPVRAELRQADLNLLLRDTLLLMRRPCERQQVELLCNEGPVPQVKMDPEKMKQALLNLVRNAQEAQPGGGSILVATGVEGDCAFVSVADHGCGIDPEHLPLIFEPFFTRKGAGTGLGLSITQRIIEEHHGRIEVESEPGRGTRFTLYLPLEQG